MNARRLSFSDTVVEIVTGLVGARLDELATSLARGVALLRDVDGIAVAAVATVDPQAARVELDVATRAEPARTRRHTLAQTELQPLLDRLRGDDALLLPGGDPAEPPSPPLVPAILAELPAGARIFLPLRAGNALLGFLHVATAVDTDDAAADPQGIAAMLAALQPPVAQALQRKRAWDGLREVADTGAIATGGNVFDWAAHLLAATLHADIAFVGRVNLDFAATVTSLAACDTQRTIGNFSYALAPRTGERRRQRDPRFPPRASDALPGAVRPVRAADLRPGDEWLRAAGLQSWFGIPLHGAAGQVLGVVAVMFRAPPVEHERIDATLRVVSERVGAELRRLVAEEEKAGLSAVVEAMTDLVATVRPSGYVTHLNPAGRLMLGLADGADPSGLTLGTLLSVEPEAESLALHVLDDAEARGSWSENGVLRGADGGASLDVMRLVLPIRDAQGRTVSYVVVIRDISERKAQEARLLQTIAALAQSESLLEGVINNSSSMIYVKDRAGAYLLASERFRDFTGLTREQTIGRTDAELFPAEVAAAFRASDLHVIESGEPIQTEERYDGVLGPRTFLTTKFALRDAAGQPYAVCGISTDITERKHAERETRELEAKLRQAQRMESIGRLSGGIAHDFNNILAAILGYTELAQMEASGHPAVVELLNEILAAALRARDLVAQLLAFSRRGEPPVEAIAVAPVVREVAKMLRSTLPATIAIDVEVADDLPAVRISPVQLHQILMNLGINARDALGGNGRVGIRVAAVDVDPASNCASCRQDFHGNFVRFAVRDDGEGIRAEDLPRLFEPFFTTKEVGRGTGLGLSVLHGIVHSAGGHVAVDSRAGAGSEFRVYLPALEGTAPSVEAADTARHVPASLAARILIVDDEAAILACQRQLLEALGCSVAGFSDPEAALAHFRAAPGLFDLVITDQTMPAVTGTELAAAIARERADLPVILCTGHLSDAVEDGARAAGVRTVLEKPVPAAVLLQAVRSALG